MSNRDPAAEPLIALYEEWQRAQAEHVAACQRQDAAENAHFAAQEELEASRLAVENAEKASSEACHRKWDVVDRIGLTPAHGPLGALIKLQIAAFEIRNEHMQSEPKDSIDRLIMRAGADAERLARSEAAAAHSISAIAAE